MSIRSKKAAFIRLAAAAVVVVMTSGCAATYVPVAWGYTKKVRTLAAEDPTLQILFGHCDPEHTTVRFPGESFNEVMMPSEVKNHLGAYRPDTKQIYRNLEYTPNDEQLRDLLVHEIAHHCWYNKFSEGQRIEWQQHLASNPSPLQDMVRRVYPDPRSYDTEDFAFTIEYARPTDVQELVRMKVITEPEGEKLLQVLAKRQQQPQEGEKTHAPGKKASSPPMAALTQLPKDAVK